MTINTTDSLFAAPLLLIQGFAMPWWFQLVIIFFVSVAAIIYHQLKMKRLKNEKSEMERKMLEKVELLQYTNRIEQKAREEADIANRSKRMLVSKITHDIRTPMNAMMGMASLLNETTLNTEQRGFTASILESGDGLLTLINDILMNDILEYSKVDSGKELEIKDFGVRNSIEEVLDVFASKAAAVGIDLIYDVADNVPLQMAGDAYRLRQILMNLVENSFRFITSGEILITANLKAVEVDGLNIEFEVRDTGKGMTSERLQIVSEDLSSSDVTNNKCIGLTLIICKKLVALMGGSIKVESRENEGTVFTFNIIAQKSLQPLRRNNSEQVQEYKGKRVLIVDDNTRVSDIIKNWLTKWNLQTYTASSGKNALELLESNTAIDLVITDLHMPEMDGLELGKLISKIKPAIPVILLNNACDESYKQHDALFSAIVNKPVKQHLLSKQIYSAFRQTADTCAIAKHNQKQKLSVDFARQHPMRILLGEDDAMNQLMVKMVLSKLGYQVHVCGNGKEILEEVSHHAYDLILMDVEMPEMDGLEATRMIRLCLSEQPVIIAMTAHTMQGDREECLRAGMDDYLSKPVKLEELVDLFEKWFAQVKESSMKQLRA